MATRRESIINDGLERIFEALDEDARRNQIEDSDTIYYLKRNWPDIDLAEAYRDWIGAMD
jgi:hypothetical protein